jgi:two-component system, cell cycle sensor histidine kinase and response regulator CckA
VRRDGRTVVVMAQRTPISFDGARSILVIARDVTQTRELEEQLRQAQKMDAIGRLAGGVAHDFNNLLGIVLNYAEFAIGSLDERHPAVADVQEIAAAARRAAALTRQLLLFSRKQTPQTKVVALDSVVTDVQRMLSRVIGADIRMTTALAARPGSIDADPSQLEQVLLNLVVNARDAMPGGGNLTIETAQVELDGVDARAAGIKPGRYVMLAVRDTGCGMDAATASRVFEPFFTTKDVGKGTGLGLATVFGIVQQHGGGISIETAPGRGTTFRLYFPRVVRAVDSLRPPAMELLPSGPETVLVVDDDERIRAVVRRILTDRGYSVLEARNAHAALDQLQDRADDVRLVVTDLVMPGIDGRSMAGQVLERYPHIRMLYMSGYTEHPAVKVALTRRDHFLQKPFGAHELEQAVRRALDEESAAA